MGYQTFLQQFKKPSTEELKYSDSHCISVMSRLGSRMDDWSPSILGFSLPEKVTKFAATMLKKKIAKSDKTCFIEGRQHVFLMMVCMCTYAHRCEHDYLN